MKAGNFAALVLILLTNSALCQETDDEMSSTTVQTNTEVSTIEQSTVNPVPITATSKRDNDESDSPYRPIKRRIHDWSKMCEVFWAFRWEGVILHCAQGGVFYWASVLF